MLEVLCIKSEYLLLFNIRQYITPFVLIASRSESGQVHTLGLIFDLEGH